MPPVKRLSLLALVVVSCLGEKSLLAQFGAPSLNLASPDLAAPADGWFFGNPGVWGRVNPNFWGYPTVSIATDLVVLSRAAPHPQPILYDGSFNPLLDASQLGASSAAGGRFNVTFFGMSGWDFMVEGLFMGDFDRQRTVDSANGVNLI